MILGIGVDIVEIARIRSLIERHQQRFLNRIFTDFEIAFCSARHDPSAGFAARFAAKEAFVKALGTGMSGGIRFHDIQVEGQAKPLLNITGKALALAQARGMRLTHVSLSHEREYAVAMVIVEGAL